MKQNINIYSGLLGGENSREIIVPKGRLQVESGAKYQKGIATVFGLDNQVGSINGSTENYFNPNLNVNSGNSDDDGLFNRLLGD